MYPDQNHDDLPGTPHMLVLMSIATALATLIIAVSLTTGDMWMLVPTMLAVLVGAAVVVFAISRALGDDGEPAESAEAGAEPVAAEPAARDDHARRARSRYAPDRTAARH